MGACVGFVSAYTHLRYCMQLLYVSWWSKIGLSCITPAILNQSGRHFKQWRRFKWDASLKTLGVRCQGRPKWPRKKRTFLSRIQRLWNAISQRPIWNLETTRESMWSSICSKKKCELFSLMDHFIPRKRLFDVCFTGCLVNRLQTQWLIFESKWPFILRTKDVPLSGELPFWRYFTLKVPKIRSARFRNACTPAPAVTIAVFVQAVCKEVLPALTHSLVNRQWRLAQNCLMMWFHMQYNNNKEFR